MSFCNSFYRRKVKRKRKKIWLRKSPKAKTRKMAWKWMGFRFYKAEGRIWTLTIITKTKT